MLDTPLFIERYTPLARALPNRHALRLCCPAAQTELVVAFAYASVYFADIELNYTDDRTQDVHSHHRNRGISIPTRWAGPGL